MAQESTALTPAAVVTTALATQDETLKGLLEGTGMSPMKFRQDVLLTLAKTPKLQEICRTQQGVTSLVAAAVDAAQLGLRVGSTLQLAALVPYGNEVKLLVQYQGKNELALKSGLVRSVAMGFACENDTFDYSEGSDPFVTHRKCLSGERGKIVAGYAVATMADGTKVVRIVDREEAMKARAKSQGYATAVKHNKTDNSWQTHEGEMWAKTAVHRLSKVLPKTPRLREMEADGRVLVDADEPTGDVEPTFADGGVVDSEPSPPVHKVDATIERADGTTVNTETGEVGPWRVTQARADTITKARKDARISSEALRQRVAAQGLPADLNVYTEAQYNELFLLIEELGDQLNGPNNQRSVKF